MNTLVQLNKVRRVQISVPRPLPLSSLRAWQDGASSRFRYVAVFLLSLCMFNSSSFAQTANTGAVTGTITDPSGALVTNAAVKVTSEATGEVRTVNSGDRGTFLVPQLEPGSYTVEASKAGFKVSTFPNVHVDVTETEKLDIRLAVGNVSEKLTVTSDAEQLQTESSALGRVIEGDVVTSLPLVTRNYTQIIALSPGISAEVTNAGELGRGNGGNGGDAFVANGVPSNDNNFQMNGVEINDLQGGIAAGVAIPNPDTIQEFKVQTGQYDAAYGRNAGANVDLITRGGSNAFHGTLFEFFRNEALNANEFFRSGNKQPRAILRQNQFGFTLGGPIKRDRVLFFVSYQGTRQLNGLDPQCSSNFSTPPFTNDRSAAAIGALFAAAGPQAPTIGQLSGLGGSTVLADGSNISPQALALLNLKLPNGQFVIPTPQRIDPSKSFYGQGISSVSSPCPFNENQFMTNADWLQSDKSRWSGRFFWATSTTTFTLPGPNLGGPGVLGFPAPGEEHFRNFSLTHNYIFSPHLLNQAEFGFHRTLESRVQHVPFTFSDIGVNAPAFDNAIPEIFIGGNVTLGGNGQGFDIPQNTYVGQDNLSWIHGRHSFRFGGGLTYAQDNFDKFHYVGGLIFGTFSDFLLGQDGPTSGACIPNSLPKKCLSNVLDSIDLPGLFDRHYRVWSHNLYAQDDFKATPRLTLNLGFRYERIGDLADALGRNSIFNAALADRNPPAAGSFKGFVVPSNYKGPLPDGVTRVNNELGINGDGQHSLNPRLGFAWQLPGTDRLVLRGGYGLYHQRVTGQPLIQLLLNQPFAVLRFPQFFDNAAASFANPFPAAPAALPSFTPYSPTTAQTTTTFAPNFRPSVFQRYSLNTQAQLTNDLLMEIGFVGTRGTHQLREVSINQASLASPSNPIRGETTNTVANVNSRVPIQGFTASGITQIESEASSWYSGLEASLNKRFSHGLNFLLSYTWAKDLSTDIGSTTGPNGGVAAGDQFNQRRRYGPDAFVRQHRFVASYVYEFPNRKDPYSLSGELLGGWKLSGVTEIQSGHPLSIFNNNPANVLGTGTDFAQITPSCNVNTSGSVNKRLGQFFNTSCFLNSNGTSLSYPVVGDDGAATGFGNSGVGIVHGPGQANTNLALVKQTPFKWPSEGTNLEFRVEAFNVFNHAQFADPDTSANDSPGTFGQILSTVVNPRVLQLALKINF